MLYPILTESRLLSDLSGVWDFKLDNGNGFDEKWYEAPLKDADTMPVPASYNDLKEGADFRDHYGWVFYQRNISVPSYVKSQRIVLRCAAVTHYAKIYLNGNLICEHKGGFLPFEVELNDVLEDGDNLLTIAVNNVIDYTTLPVGGKANMMSGLMGGMGAGASEKPQNNPNFDFFNYCGITRPVKIYTTPKTYINDITVTSDIDFGKETPSAVLNYAVDIEGVDKDSTACKVEVFDAEGNKVAEAAGTQGKLELENVKLWQPLNSYLYQIKVTAGEDVYTLPYGVRSVRVDGVKFLINEKPFYFKGYGKHEDTFPNGRGINLPMNTKDISIMKWQHANSFRTSHYPYSEEMMRLCDEEGIDMGPLKTQICLQHAFGDGKRLSCSKTVDAVSGLFQNIPISGYLAMNMGGIPQMNDAVGGVEVTVQQDISFPKAGVNLKKGQKVTLNGTQAYYYLHGRDTEEYDSATKRLQREEQYIVAYMDKLKKVSTENPDQVTEIYNSVSDYLVTSVDFTSMIEQLMNYGFSEDQMYTVPGKTVEGKPIDGKRYEEYHVDEDAMEELIMKVFYTPVQ